MSYLLGLHSEAGGLCKREGRGGEGWGSGEVERARGGEGRGGGRRGRGEGKKGREGAMRVGQEPKGRETHSNTLLVGGVMLYIPIHNKLPRQINAPFVLMQDGAVTP